eukprot:TCALIF_01391-PA protein Name:"Protein of unknown function" AED:0.00 eAED:0.00 QI:59/1/1/1/1/1/2/189/26
MVVVGPRNRGQARPIDQHFSSEICSG